MNGNSSRRAPGENGNIYIKKSESMIQESEDEKDEDIKHTVVEPRVKPPKAPVQSEQIHSSSSEEKLVKLEHELDEEEEEDDDEGHSFDSLFEDALEELGDETLVNGGNGN